MHPPARFVFSVALLFVSSARVNAQSNRIDRVTPLAPDLAAYGSHALGVRTIQVTDKNRPDILNTKDGTKASRYDRTLTLEVWYPAILAAGQAQSGDYEGVVTRDPKVVVTLRGRAVRDANPEKVVGGFPLVIISHGYPGSRYLLSHLAENLASKGFVVVSIQHPDSGYDDMKAFASTLYNRPFDQLFVLNEMDRLGRKSSGSFLEGLVDASHTGMVGYSMGGYGLVNVIGGGFSMAASKLPGVPPNGML
ncbi:MAG: dienelactone hydrolase, partial [Vicinamibacteria bacterium]